MSNSMVLSPGCSLAAMIASRRVMWLGSATPSSVVVGRIDHVDRPQHLADRQPGRELRRGSIGSRCRRGREPLAGIDRRQRRREAGVARRVGRDIDEAQVGLPLAEAGRIKAGIREELDAIGLVRLTIDTAPGSRCCRRPSGPSSNSGSSAAPASQPGFRKLASNAITGVGDNGRVGSPKG